jgi:hypothetical protein
MAHARHDQARAQRQAKGCPHQENTMQSPHDRTHQENLRSRIPNWHRAPNPPGMKSLSIFAQSIDLDPNSLQVGCSTFLVGHAFSYTARTSKGSLLARREQRKPPGGLTTASFFPGEGTPAGVERMGGVRQVARTYPIAPNGRPHLDLPARSRAWLSHSEAGLPK